MVATVVSKGQLATAREVEFCRLMVAQGLTGAAAYRAAYEYKGRHSDMLAARAMARPHIREMLTEMREAGKAEGAMSMADRRNLLARIGKHKAGWRAAPTYTERIAAIREDATLAGERNEQVSISGEVSVRACLVALSLDGSSLTAAKPVGLEGPEMLGEGEDSGSGSEGRESALKRPLEASPLDVLSQPVAPGAGEYDE